MRRIAMIVPGGLASPGRGIQSPPLREFIRNLSHHVDITAYSLRDSALDPASDRSGNAVIKNLPVSSEDPLPEKALDFAKAFRADHREKPFDLVHGFWGLPGGLLAVVLGSLFGIPRFVTLLGGETANIRKIPYGNMSRLRSRWPTLWVCRNATRLFVLTDFQANQLRALGIHRPDLDVIPFGVDRKKFSRRSSRRPTAPYRILHVGNLTEVKDQQTTLRTFAEFRKRLDARLTIVGPDYLGGSIHRLARDLGLNGTVTFLGRKEHDELPREYRKADLLLHTPLHEAQGMVISEACASGVIPAGTRVGMLSDLSQLYPDVVHGADPVSIAEGMIRLIRDRSRYRGLQKALHEWSAKHDSDWTVREYMRVYESAVHRP